MGSLELDRKTLLIGIGGLILGLALGLLIGWVIWPVQWTDAYSYELSPAGRAEFMGLVADSYALDKDPALAAQHLELWEPEEKSQAVADAIQMYQEMGRADKVQHVQDLAMVLNITPGPTTPPGEGAAPAEGGGKSFWARVRPICFVFFFILLLLVLVWIGYRVATRQRERKEGKAPARGPAIPPAEEWEGKGPPPLGHFITTYSWGEDTYDESFSIENPMGEFLGECGVGISETIGSDEHDRVTAFEVWLFDKGDIRTVTKVLMSQYAFHNDALRTKLAPKGEAILAHPGATFTLETTNLQVQVNVNEMEYGQDGAPNSYFTKLAVELVAMEKPPEEPGQF